MKLLGYNRVSTDDQAKYGHSLDIQPERHAKWCEAMGHELVGVVTDSVSGAKPFEQRAGGQEVMRRLQDGEADGVIVTRFERAFRHTLSALNSANWFLDNHYSVLSIEHPIDITTPFGWKLFINMVADAEFDRAMSIVRTKEVMKGLREAGKVFGAIPYGCVEVDGFLYRDPQTWVIRESIVEQSTTRTGAVMQQIVDWLELGNIPAPGGKGKGGKEVGGKRWHKSTVSRIIKTHPDLEHIPPLPDAPESEVS